MKYFGVFCLIVICTYGGFFVGRTLKLTTYREAIIRECMADGNKRYECEAILAGRCNN
jgi:hypothetical protein